MIELYKKKSAMEDLKKHCIMAKEHDYVEVTAWHNGEGYDVSISSQTGYQHISLTYGELKLIKKLIKTLERN